MTDQFHTLRASIGPTDREGVRHEVFEGQDHLVVPVVMIVEGVLNDALLTQAEFGKFPEAWNGRPVPVLHPEIDGIPISANAPDVIERNTIGQLFNTFAENGKLKAEAWINTDKAHRLGYGQMLESLEAGEVIEVSTGYFADDDLVQGEFNGRPYSTIHRNLRPDHLALLPGEIGACSVEDGCGTRVNSTKGFIMKVNEALSTLAKAVGLQANCNCQEEPMTDTLKKQAEALKANGALSAKQYQMLSDMEADQLEMVQALVAALMGQATNEEDEPEVEAVAQEYEDKETMNANTKEKLVDVKALVANEVKEAIRRDRVMQKLVANAACPYDEAELQDLSVNHLEKLEKSIRPVDYSGQGGFATNSDAIESNVTPLRLNGVVARKKEA
jgi:hypothetical protein